MYKHIWLFTCYIRHLLHLWMSCLHWMHSRQTLPTMLVCEALWQKHHDLSSVKESWLPKQWCIHTLRPEWLIWIRSFWRVLILWDSLWDIWQLGHKLAVFFLGTFEHGLLDSLLFLISLHFLLKIVWHVFILSAFQSRLYFPENFLYFPKFSLSSFKKELRGFCKNIYDVNPSLFQPEQHFGPSFTS